MRREEASTDQTEQRGQRLLMENSSPPRCWVFRARHYAH